MNSAPQELPHDGTIDTECLRHLYEIYRDYMKHEDDLLNHRTTWLLVIQGFLFTTLGVLGEWQLPKDGRDLLYTERHWLVYVLVGVGVTIAIAAFISILAANHAIDNLAGTWQTIRENRKNPDWGLLPGIAGGGLDSAKKMGKIPALCIPGIIAIAWLVVAGMAIRDNHYSLPAPNSSTAPPSVNLVNPQPLAKQELIDQVAGALEHADELQQQLQNRFGTKVLLVHLTPQTKLHAIAQERPPNH